MRRCLERDFDAIYVLDLGGNVRKNPKLSGTTHNVFGIQVGVSISLLVKKKEPQPKQAKIYYARVDEFWRKEEKYDFLDDKEHIGNVDWAEKRPDLKYNWLTEGMSADFESFLPLGTKETKGPKKGDAQSIFKTFSLGVSTNRDRMVYDFNRQTLESRIERLSNDYNAEVSRYIQRRSPQDVDGFVNYEGIKWSRNLKRHFKNGDELVFDRSSVRLGLYRPFTKQYLYFADIAVDEPGRNQGFLPNTKAEAENRVLCVPSLGGRSDYWCFCSNLIPNLALTSIDATQCFPFYTYAEDGSNRRENITDWALEQFRTHYQDDSISKWDIFHCVYAILHHPQYRDKYAANLRRELPRIPFAPDFRGFAEAGAKLADLHVNYEKQPEYRLQRLESKDVPLNWRVEKMRLSKDKTQLVYNDFLTLGGIPPEVFEYRLGNRSALEWIIDQYQVSTDKRSGIVNDPNGPDDPQYIVRLIGKVTTVSLETTKIVKSLPALE
jgi:predicted helicase